MNRNALLAELQREPETRWDVIVIGGGATGLGVALDAVTRGFKTLLLEQADFAKGTSSRSTKLVHGGVRYLAQGDVVLVMEALKERGRMLRNAPHITRNQEFVIPIYGWWDALMYTVGLTLYDLLAGRLGLGKSHFISKKRTLACLPLLRAQGLIGGVVYHDGQFDDARMAMTLVHNCVERGGVLLNYFKVMGLLKNDSGKVAGVRARDMETGSERDLAARLVVNATGVFADDILRMDNPAARPTIRPSQGVHLVLDRTYLQGQSAMMIPKTDDGRVLFAIPWYDKVVVGTTDTPLDTISMEPVPLEEEVNFILRTVGRYLTRAPTRKDVLCIFAGLRPLAADPDNPSSTKEISRRHKIVLSSTGLLSILGGKWTIYRRMAQDTLDKAIHAGLLEDRKCNTEQLALDTMPTLAAKAHLPIYGSRAAEIGHMIDVQPELGAPMDSRLPYSRAEMIWICRNEMPRTLEDILARRTRALFLDARASGVIAPAVASLMAQELGFDEHWQQQQVTSFNQLIRNYQ